MDFARMTEYPEAAEGRYESERYIVALENVEGGCGGEARGQAQVTLCQLS